MKALENLAAIGQLKRESASRKEFDGLVRAGTRKLRDAKIETLDTMSRFDLAYNAAHALALAALRWRGYRSEPRYLVFQVLAHTLALGADSCRLLDHAHRLRNLAEYEGEVDVPAAMLKGLLVTTDAILSRVVALAPIAAE